VASREAIITSMGITTVAAIVVGIVVVVAIAAMVAGRRK
jgi:hypothetical protein